MNFENFFHRNNETNKYDYGHVLIIGGAPGMVGAPLLSGLSALRVGAGLVTITSSSEVIDKLEKRVLEIMTLRLPDNNDEALETIIEFIEKRRVSVVVFGPGFDTTTETLVKNIIGMISIPIVLDAGAVTMFHDDLTTLKKVAKHNQKIILTPHDGEFEKLTGTKLATEIDKRKETAAAFAKIYGLTLVCKGTTSLVAHPDANVYVNSTSNPGMATAGTGDVLDGIIAGLIAQGFTLEDATDNGIYIHGLAGDLVAEEKTQVSLIASDLIESLPLALKKIEADLKNN